MSYDDLLNKSSKNVALSLCLILFILFLYSLSLLWFCDKKLPIFNKKNKIFL